MSSESQPEPTTIAETGYLPTQASQRQRREYSEWDPRSAPGTYFLMAVNVAVFVWMVCHHVSWTSPATGQLEQYGANNAFDVLAHGQWYRLVTAIFVHIGIIHIASNMWCLWNLGLLGEPLVGPFGLIAVYVLTGVAGNMLRITWDVLVAHFLRQPLEFTSVMGAGASGAVFGIAGILIVLLSNHRLPIPWRELKRLRKSVIQFAVINLVIGLGTLVAGPVRVDNFAHIGGFIAGLAIGPGLISAMTLGRARYLGRQKVVFASAAFVLSLYGYWIANFR